MARNVGGPSIWQRYLQIGKINIGRIYVNLVMKVVSYDVIMKTRSHRFSYGKTKDPPCNHSLYQCSDVGRRFT